MNAEQTLDVLVNFPVTESILIAGNHGIGKSQIVKQAAAKLGIPCIDFRLSQNDIGDLKGMPFHVKGRTVFAPPEFMPLRESDAEEIRELLDLAENVSMGVYGDSGILFLDEINRASREVQQAAFELVLDRRLNLRSLPGGWRVVAAVNDNNDIYAVSSMEPALLSRFFLIDFKPTTQEWLTWARLSGVNSTIIRFITEKPEFLDPPDELLSQAAVAGVKKVHDRRAWEKFSDTLNKFESDFRAGGRRHHPLSTSRENLDYLVLLASGFVGHLAAVRFCGFVKTKHQSLDAKSILNNWDSSVRQRLLKIIDSNQTTELAAYNDRIITHVANFYKNKNLSVKAKNNLAKYLRLLPNELIADFWKNFNLKCKIQSEDWYGFDKNNSSIIMRALVKPDAGHQHKAA